MSQEFIRDLLGSEMHATGESVLAFSIQCVYVDP